jgi:hypothetical protein
MPGPSILGATSFVDPVSVIVGWTETLGAENCSSWLDPLIGLRAKRPMSQSLRDYGAGHPPIWIDSAGSAGSDRYQHPSRARAMFASRHIGELLGF